MALYRIARLITTDAIEVEASSPEEAKAILDKQGVEAKGEFSHTVIEEVLKDQKGYREETTEDVIGTVKAEGVARL